MDLCARFACEAALENALRLDRAIVGNHLNLDIHALGDKLAQKRRLTDLTVHSGENWLGDLSNDELDQLFRLSL